MSNVYSKSVEGCVVDPERAFAVAAARAAKGGRGKRLGTFLGRASGFSLALGTCGMSAFLGMQFGHDAATTRVGQAILRSMEPVFSTLGSMTAVQGVVAIVVMGVAALVWYVRG
jgi:hypothetical protein